MIRPVARLVLVGLLGVYARPGLSQDAIPPPPPAPRPVPPAAQGDLLIVPRRDQIGAEARPGAAGDIAAAVGALLGPPADLPLLDQVRLAGLRGDARPEALSWERVYQLAWIHAHAQPPPRFEALDPARLVEQARGLGMDDFARFRGEFLASKTFRDPATSFLDLQARLQQVACARRHLGHAERLSQVFRELVNGEAAGLGQIDLDLIDAASAGARRELARLTADYRDRLDEFKVALGLAPRAAVTVDPTPLAAFPAAFARFDRWAFSPGRDLAELDRIVAGCPALGDLVLDRRPVLAEVAADPTRLADVLALAARYALGNRPGGDESADATELVSRRRVRRLVDLRDEYAAELRGLVLAERLLDQVFEQIIAPPPGDPSRSPGARTGGLLEHAGGIARRRGRLVGHWAAFQAERLAVERDLGLVIATDWPTFLARFAPPVPPDEPPPAPGRPPRAPSPVQLLPISPLTPAPPPNAPAGNP